MLNRRNRWVQGMIGLGLLVAHDRNSASERTSYTGLIPAGNVGPTSRGKVGSTLYAPVLKRA